MAVKTWAGAWSPKGDPRLNLPGAQVQSERLEVSGGLHNKNGGQQRRGENLLWRR
jgi:hypothetical protein